VNSIKSLCVLTILALTAVGCGDDSSSSGTATISCDMPSMKLCGTGAGTAKECTDTGGTVVGSCASGALLTCKDVVTNGQKGTVYIYDQATIDLFKGMDANGDACAAIAANS